MSIDEVSRRPDDWMDAVDARDRIDDVRAAMASWCLPAAQAAQLRALIDDHARLRAELSDVLAERDAMQAMATQNGRERGDGRPRGEGGRGSRKEEAMTPEREADIRARAWGLATSDDHGAVDRIDLLAALDEARRERDAARAEVAALQVVMGRLREAADAAFPIQPGTMDHGRVIPPERARLYQVLGAIPADLGRKTIEEAEERGAQWGIEAASEAAPESEYFVQWPDPAEVCRVNRERGVP